MQQMVVADPMGHLLAGFAAWATMITPGLARPMRPAARCPRASSLHPSVFSPSWASMSCLRANNFLVIYLGLGADEPVAVCAGGPSGVITLSPPGGGDEVLSCSVPWPAASSYGLSMMYTAPPVAGDPKLS